jgi:peptidoglycan/xylan/chitin deacetylase (PgdA/CDA1 family)
LDYLTTKYGPYFYFKNKNLTKKYLSITFDDAPNRSTTNTILDALRRHDIHATFFIIGNRAQYQKDILKRIVREGHELGNHDWKDRWSISVPNKTLEKDIQRTQDLIGEFKDCNEIKWFRPGSGFYNKNMLKMVNNMGYKVVLRDTYSFDAHVQNPLWISMHTLLKVKSGSIIIMHDGIKRGKHIRVILDNIIPILKKRGYEFVTLSQMKLLNE